MTENGQTDAWVAEFITDLRQTLAETGDPARAEQQRACLKSEMAMYGVGVPDTQRPAQRIAAAHSDVWAKTTTWEAALRHLWDGTTRREERYATLAVIRIKLSASHAGYMEPPAFYEHFLHTRQWWDLVDEASHVVGLVMRERPAAMARIRVWATDPGMWIRRSAILCQLQHRAGMNLGLLADVVEVNQEDPEFFIRKAIGWALRDYACTDGDWVRTFVQAHPGLPPLSRRGTLKHLWLRSGGLRHNTAGSRAAQLSGRSAVGTRASTLPQPHAIRSHQYGTAHA